MWDYDVLRSRVFVSCVSCYYGGLYICTMGVYLQTLCQSSPTTQPLAWRRYYCEGVWRIAMNYSSL